MIRHTIENLFAAIYREQYEESAPEMNDDSVLLQSGLDSLGFAILVARLDEVLGFDPFTASPDPFYPRTFGEFVRFYEDVARDFAPSTPASVSG